MVITFFKTFFFFFFFTFFIYNFSFGQSFTPESFRNMKVNELTEDNIARIKDEMNKRSLTISTLETLATSNGMSVSDFNLLKVRLESITPAVTETNVEQGTNIVENPIKLDASSSIPKSEIFGSQIFNNPALSFEPNSNMMTPASYVLGTGDELLIVIYGMQEFSYVVHINKDGKINIPVIGQLYLKGINFEASKLIIKKACSKVYSSLFSGQSNISVTLTKSRTINVTMLGVKSPGNYMVSSLSTVFNALHIAGGPDANGTYRNIELIRNNKVIKTIDIYKFLTTGDLSENINLLENDVIRVPVYVNRVKIEGNVKITGVFELLPNENFNDLLKYCSGFTEAAYKSNIKLLQNTDKELKIIDLSEKEYNEYTPKSGDVFKVSTILNKFENKISIRGSVYRPDDYALTEGMTLKNLIDKADGLTEDAYRINAQLIREKADLTKEFISLDLNAIISGSKNIILKKNDEIIISSIFDIKNQQTISIIGQVNKEGEFPFIENIKLYDLILQAGGLTDKASRFVEITSVIIKDSLKNNLNQIATSKAIEIDSLLKDQSKNVVLNPFDIVQVRKKPIYEDQTFVSISGEVQFPGNYVLTNANETFLSVLERSGGLTSEANIEAIYVLRNVDKIKTDNFIEKKEIKIPIDYTKVKKRPTSFKNIILKASDQIIVKKRDNNVKINGAVYLNSEIAYSKNKKLKYYINSVGGYSENVDKKRIYVVYQNGLGNATKSFLFFKKYPKIQSGCEIIVPLEKVDQNNNKLSITELSIITGVIGSVAGMTIAIINLLSK